MAQQHLNYGAAPDDGTGDDLRAGAAKIEANFTDLYDRTDWPNYTFKALPIGADMFVGYDADGNFRTSGLQIVGMISALINTIKNTLQIDGNDAAAPRSLVVAVDDGYAAEVRFNSGGVGAFVMSKTVDGELAFDRYVDGDFAGRSIILDRDTGVVSLTEGLAHSGPVGFFGATPTTKPTITGSRGGNAALASLLTQLAALGLITNSTTA